ncbi:MAG: ECF transporter S component [Spirochaetota bacterium]
MKSFLVIILAGATAALTIVVRIPIPGTGGYLNFGDVAVIFCGLFLGKIWGPVAGGVGSALADLIGGFFIFAPVTLIAKGLEGFLAGIIGQTKIPVVLLPLAGLSMIAVYFMAELFLPGMGLGAAVSELPFNAIQALVGAFGGYAVYLAVKSALPRKED